MLCPRLKPGSFSGSNQPFDLLETMSKNSYLNYMGNNVIKNKSNLQLSYNFEEKSIRKHIKSTEKEHLEFISKTNPFGLYNGLSAKYRLLNSQLLDSESDEEETEPSDYSLR